MASKAGQGQDNGMTESETKLQKGWPSRALVTTPFGHFVAVLGHYHLPLRVTASATIAMMSWRALRTV